MNLDRKGRRDKDLLVLWKVLSFYSFYLIRCVHIYKNFTLDSFVRLTENLKLYNYMKLKSRAK